VILREKGYLRFIEAMEDAVGLAIGAPTLLEVDIVVLRRFEEDGREFVSEFLSDYRVEVISFGALHRRIARKAYAGYGKGRHPARLNFGDCMTYATARLADAPLLFTGEDFAKTDLVAALE
jgi:ribonuclease VapC